MARRPNQTRAFRALIEKLTPDLQRAFHAAIADLRDRVDMAALVDRLRANDIAGAIEALNLSPGAFYQYAAVKTSAYAQGGALAATTINGPPGGQVLFRFDMANPRAEAWIAEHVAGNVTRMTDEARQGIRATILEAYSKGQHPNDIARDIGGRMLAGKRQGGIIGLSGPQMGYVHSMRARLESGVKGEMERVFGMTRRDKRFDHLIRKAIAEGRPLSKTDIDAMIQRYTDRLLAKRAEDIARTETGIAVMSARAEEWQQAVDKLGYPAEAVLKTWVHGGGVKDPRPHHVAANNMRAQGLSTAFVLSNGAVMQHALDPAGGAAECANCTCDTTFRMDHSWGLT